MTLPPLLELVYEKVLSLSSEIGEYVSEVTNTGVGYGDTVASLVQKRTEQVSPSWMPKRQVVSAPGQAPCILTRIPVLTALRSGGINFVRIGGISGFLALAIGAYGAYVFSQDAQSCSTSQSGANAASSFYGGRTQSQGRTVPAQNRTLSQQSGSSPTYRSSRISSHYASSDVNECPDEEKSGFDENKKEIFNIANRYHFIHSLALLATPLFKCPNLTGILLTAGMILFCGSSYLHVLTDNKDICRVTPYGGVLLLFAWLTMIF